MKDFIKWLGNNEKVGKVIVWLLIIIIALIILNTTLMSLGLPHYQITEQHVISFQITKLIDDMISWLICALNFCSIIYLIFPVKMHKKIRKYLFIYLVFTILFNQLFGYMFTQVYIILYIIIFSYIFSKRNTKYIFYSLVSLFINALIEFICYSIKLKYINVTEISHLTNIVLGFDYFIIMGLIILVKEIYIKKRGEKNGCTKFSMVVTIQQRKDICKETSKKSIKSSKITNKEVVSAKK